MKFLTELEEMKKLIIFIKMTRISTRNLPNFLMTMPEDLPDCAMPKK